MSNLSRKLMAVAAALLIASASSATSAPSSSSSGSSRPSSSSSYSKPSTPSSSYSKPAAPAPAATAPAPKPIAAPPIPPRESTPPAASNGGFSKPTVQPAAPPTPVAAPTPAPNRSALPAAAAGAAAGAAIGAASTPANADTHGGYSKPGAPEPSKATAAEPPKPAPTAQSQGGYSKPAATEPPKAVATTPPPTNTSGYSKPNTPEQQRAATGPPPQPQNALSAAANRSMSAQSLEQYRKERAEAQAPPRPVSTEQVRKDPVVTETRKQYTNVDQYMQQRQRDMDSYRTRAPEVQTYSQGMSPNYGMFDNSFLMGLILGHLGSNSGNAAWLNGQRDTEWYREWRRDMDRKAQENAELKSKLEKMDREMAELSERRDFAPAPKPTALPAGVPSSIAVAPEAMIAAHEEPGSSKTLWIILGILGSIAVGALGYFYVLGSRK